MKKGQMVFEFIVAAVFFLAIIIYVINYLNTTVSLYDNEYYSGYLESRAMEISEILVKNQGIWEGEVPVVPGLALEWPVLNHTKMLWFNAYCNINYEDFARDIGIDPQIHGFMIEIREEGLPGTRVLCGILPRGIVNARTERIALSEFNRPLYVFVWTW